ncbi:MULTISPECIES: hypothetical protein [Aphanothece]|uniref:hypothetical protein n=1 Tax=Aphanothece TaxID=1121 RepID=UPI003984F1E2
MSDPRFFRCDGRLYDEQAKNPLRLAVRDLFNSIPGTDGSRVLRRVKTDLNIKGKRFSAFVKGQLKDISGETDLNLRFELELVARGRAIVLKKNNKIATEFNAKRLQGIISFRDPSIESFNGTEAIAFNLQTIVPIKMCKDVFLGNFGTTFAKIDFTRSSFTGQGFFGGISSSQVASTLAGGIGGVLNGSALATALA